MDLTQKKFPIKFADRFFRHPRPSGKNRQGNNVGSQYRSIVLYTNKEQKKTAEQFFKNINESSPKGRPVVTEIKPLDKFFEADDYHKDYYARNKSAPYCQIVINPKLEKVKKEFGKLLKTSEN